MNILLPQACLVVEFLCTQTPHTKSNMKHRNSLSETSKRCLSCFDSAYLTLSSSFSASVLSFIKSFDFLSSTSGYSIPNLILTFPCIPQTQREEERFPSFFSFNWKFEDCNWKSAGRYGQKIRWYTFYTSAYPERKTDTSLNIQYNSTLMDLKWSGHQRLST